MLRAVPHIPGETARPEEGSIRPGLSEGLSLYRAGFYWEAHEALEPLWLSAAPNSQARAYLQALIQLANAQLKHKMNKPAAAARILGLVHDHLSRLGAAEAVLGQDPAWIMGEAARLESRITGEGGLQHSATFGAMSAEGNPSKPAKALTNIKT